MSFSNMTISITIGIALAKNSFRRHIGKGFLNAQQVLAFVIQPQYILSAEDEQVPDSFRSPDRL
jgi:hypothetical protein